MNKIKNVIKEDIFSKDYLIKNYSKKFYGYLKSTNSSFFVNNNKVDLDYHLKSGDIYEIHYYNKTKNTIKVNKPIDILYEDEYLLIVDKPFNLLTIPSRNNIDSIYSRVIFHYPNDSINILTRLDKDTKGIVVIAKKHYLVDKININKKMYLAKTINLLDQEEGIINLPIKKSNTIKRVIDDSGKESITKYKLIDKDKHIYQLTLLTGRTHQIRVHLSYFNCSIIGDSLYGNTEGELNLICSNIELIHPITHKIINVSSKYRLE